MSISPSSTTGLSNPNPNHPCQDRQREKFSLTHPSTSRLSIEVLPSYDSEGDWKKVAAAENFSKNHTVKTEWVMEAEEDIVLEEDIVIVEQPSCHLFSIVPIQTDFDELSKYFPPEQNFYQEINFHYKTAEEVVTFFKEDAAHKLCPSKKQLDDQLLCREKFSKENFNDLVQFITTNIECDEKCTERMIKFLEWNAVNGTNADSASPTGASVSSIISELIEPPSPLHKKKLQLPTATVPDGIFAKIKAFFYASAPAPDFSTLEGVLPNLSDLSEVEYFYDLSRKIEEFFRQEWAKAIVKAIDLRPLLKPFLTAAKAKQSISRDEEEAKSSSWVVELL